MVKKRSPLEICADVLRISKEGAKKSHIVYKANLNFKIVNEYLTHLQETGLITFPSNNEPLFKTTPKGLEYIDQYTRLTRTFNTA
ncbi:MAG: hypothetical protein QG670_2275 [Thermoproteota archaeon]|nr:hypothetical protein [Thermoproteota archaeon]